MPRSYVFNYTFNIDVPRVEGGGRERVNVIKNVIPLKNSEGRQCLKFFPRFKL